MEETITTIDDAANGLAEWALSILGGVPGFSITNWRPTVSHIDAAARSGMTWSYERWEHATGNDGLAGIHSALRIRGWNISSVPTPVYVTGA